MQKQMTDFFPKTIVIPVSDEMVRSYTEVSEDWNPIHISENAAQQAGYPKKIVQGMLTMAVSTRLVSPLLGKTGMIESFTMKFSSPVYVNDRLTVNGDLLPVNEGKLHIRVSGKNQHEQVVIRGKVTVVFV